MAGGTTTSPGLPLTTADLHKDNAEGSYEWNLLHVRWGDVLKYQHWGGLLLFVPAVVITGECRAELLPPGMHQGSCCCKQAELAEQGARQLDVPCDYCCPAAVSHWTFQEKPVVRQALLYDATIRCALLQLVSLSPFVRPRQLDRCHKQSA